MAFSKLYSTSTLLSHQFSFSLYVTYIIYLPSLYFLFFMASSCWIFYLCFLYIYKSLNFFNLNYCFLVNLELITNSIAPLSNSTLTVISFYISIPFKPTCTITSLRGFFQFGLPACIILLVSTVNLFEELS